MLQLINLSKIFITTKTGQPVEALRDINLEIEEGQFITIAGITGCGKTTILRMVAGLEVPSKGKVLLDGKEINGPGPRMGLVFQEYGLLPWRTVLGNIEFGLELKGIKRETRREKVRDYIRIMELEGFEDKYPKELSGGMKQRVAIARTLIVKPRILLMDEPFGALDYQTRNSLQEFLLGLWERTKTTILFVTHNIDEAVFLGQKVVILTPRPGTIREIFPINLRYPRDRTGLDFNQYKREIQRALSDQQLPLRR